MSQGNDEAERCERRLRHLRKRIRHLESSLSTARDRAMKVELRLALVEKIVLGFAGLVLSAVAIAIVGLVVTSAR